MSSPWSRPMSLLRRRALIKRTEDRIERLRQLCVDGVIAPADYKKDLTEAQNERERLREELKRAGDPTTYLKPMLDAANSLIRAPELMRTGEPEEKKQLIDTLTCNVRLSRKKLLIEAKKPFVIYGEWRTCPTLSE